MAMQIVYERPFQIVQMMRPLFLSSPHSQSVALIPCTTSRASQRPFQCELERIPHGRFRVSGGAIIATGVRPGEEEDLVGSLWNWWVPWIRSTRWIES